MKRYIPNIAVVAAVAGYFLVAPVFSNSQEQVKSNPPIKVVTNPMPQISYPEKLSQIVKRFEEIETNCYPLELGKRNYLFSIENLDDDGKPDFMLIIGTAGDKKFPKSLGERYLKDFSSINDVGTVEDYCLYLEQKDEEKKECSEDDLEKICLNLGELRKELKDLKKRSEYAENREVLKKEISVVVEKIGAFKDGERTYQFLIDFLYENRFSL